MKRIYLKSVRDLKDLGKQGIVLILILGLCVGFVTSMLYMVTDILPVFRGFFREANAADYTYETRGFNSSFLEEVKDIDGVKEVQARLIVQIPLEIEGREEILQLRLVGVNVDENFNKTHNLKIYNYNIISGENLDPTDNRSLILTKKFVERNEEIKIGDTINLDALGNANLTIKGSFHSMEFVLVNSLPEVSFPVEGTLGVAFISQKILYDLLKEHRLDLFRPYQNFEYNQLQITIKEGSDPEQVNEQIEDKLEAFDVIKISSTSFENSYSWKWFKSDLEGAQSFMAVLLILAIVMAFTSSLSIFMRFVLKQKRQIGTLSSLGYTKYDIMKSFLFLLFIISIISSLIGGLIGYGFMAGMFIEMGGQLLGISYIYPFQIKFIWTSFLICVVLAVLAIIPAIRKLLNFDITDLLYQKERLYSRVSRKKKPSKRKASRKVIWRNLLRHPKKNILNLVGIAFSLIIVAGSLIMTTSMNYTVNSKILETEKWDASITISDTVDFDADLLNQIENIPDIEALDYGLKLPITMENPESDVDEELTQILGLNRNFSMHEYKLVEYKGKESKLYEHEDEVVISLTLMRKMEFKIDDKVNITVPTGKERQFTIVGVSDEIMGLIHTDLMELQNFTQLPDQINSLYVQYKSGLSEGEKEKLISEIYDISERIVIVQDMEDIIDSISQYAQLLIPFMGIIILFAAIVEFFILYNATLMSIGDHESEYGILRSLGYNKRKIYIIIISENLLPIILSVAFSLILMPYIGLWLISLWQEQFSISLHLPPWIFIATIIVPILITLFAGRSGLKYIYSRTLYEQVQTSYVA
ncbi:MAG: membrane protein of unknown function [Promethearchaeota archaeon]|nr:MAG: membrane protein of unknown function [Candidatus Lokiarchaeota archaeon]